ncbi:MAG: hypothetical protein AAF827_08720 [Cyanobacteria bacterium P01_D01_bin.6]
MGLIDCILEPDGGNPMINDGHDDTPRSHTLSLSLLEEKGLQAISKEHLKQIGGGPFYPLPFDPSALEYFCKRQPRCRLQEDLT